MRVYKVLINLVVIVFVLVTIYVFQTENLSGTSNFLREFGYRSLRYRHDSHKDYVSTTLNNLDNKKINRNLTDGYNVWCIFTKVKHKNSSLKYKFERFIKSLINHSSVVITLNIISDKNSQAIAESVIKTLLFHFKKNTVNTVYYNVNHMAESISNLTAIMQPIFSPQRGGYYSDALFYMSLDLYRLADSKQVKAVMIDIDTELRADIALLFDYFDSFTSSELLGLAPELSPVYQHVLYLYRSRNKNTKFGSPLSKGGLPGLNSGVVLFHFDKLRNSQLYKSLMTKDVVNNMITKYSFMGHLGDQDMYTLIQMEHPELIHVLPCGWNRQLCKWWRDHGYPDVFDSFARCDGPISLYHGNCNTPIPYQINSVQNKSG